MGNKQETKTDRGIDRPGVRQVPEGSGEHGKMEKTGCEIICGALTTLAVKGLMMMMWRLQGSQWHTVCASLTHYKQFSPPLGLSCAWSWSSKFASEGCVHPLKLCTVHHPGKKNASSFLLWPNIYVHAIESKPVSTSKLLPFLLVIRGCVHYT